MIIATMPKIKVESGICRYNFRCHYNAVHDALIEEDEKIAMCFYHDKIYDEWILHFIKVDSGIYTDNTLGRWSELYDYYLIRTIEKDSFFKIDEIFSSYRKELRSKLPWIVRLLSDNTF